MADHEHYRVGMATGSYRIYHDKKKAENAALLARALAAMPTITRPIFFHRPGDYTSVALAGQQSALARALGYWTNNKNPGKTPNHSRIYELWRYSYLPRSPERLQILRNLATLMPDDWHDQLRARLVAEGKLTFIFKADGTTEDYWVPWKEWPIYLQRRNGTFEKVDQIPLPAGKVTLIPI